MSESGHSEPGYTHGEQFARVGQGDHEVQPGECMASIADAYGFFWETLWDHPDNAELKRVREDPNVLMPGDRVTIPERRLKQESLALDARHRFRRKGVPEKLRLQFVDGAGEARADLAYEVEHRGRTEQGATDAEGCIELWIMPSVTRATLRFLDERGRVSESHQLDVGYLPPLDSGEGIAARLTNLGLLRPGQPLELALAEFQRSCELEPTGRFDDATRGKLRERAGS